MREYIATNDPHAQGAVDRANALFYKWHQYINETRCRSFISDKQLTLYIDQETYYDMQELRHCNGSIGPLTIGLALAPREGATTLFGINLTIIRVVHHDRYEHLIFR